MHTTGESFCRIRSRYVTFFLPFLSYLTLRMISVSRTWIVLKNLYVIVAFITHHDVYLMSHFCRTRNRTSGRTGDPGVSLSVLWVWVGGWVGRRPARRGSGWAERVVLGREWTVDTSRCVSACLGANRLYSFSLNFGMGLKYIQIYGNLFQTMAGALNIALIRTRWT